MSESRAQLIDRLFPNGIPHLWCPPLTHFQAGGELARDRNLVHLRHLGRFARGWLVPGSTGEGWQMSDDEVRAVLDLALTAAAQIDAQVLVGVLRQDAESTVACILQTADWLCRRAATDDIQQAMITQHVCGFTVCPPTGAGLSANDMREALGRVLQLKLPTALYQLPQVTKNEMPAELVAELAAEFPNFYLFKDTSGADRVATSSSNLQDVYLVRGAEGLYSQWLKAAGGPYDGFLLSTANVFAEQLAQMMALLNDGKSSEAEQVILPVQHAVPEVFRLVATLPWGNAFTNANKAMDHFMAFGPHAAATEVPYLHDGQVLPTEILDATRGVLDRFGLLPANGYLTLA